jgi:SAM-dependent methyltransferase
MSVDDAVRSLRSDPAQADLVRDAYLGRDVADSARRFLRGEEFREVCRLLGPRLAGARVLDVGAGVGFASHAMLAAGAAHVIALEPDSSDEVGRGAIGRLDPSRRIEVIDAWGEEIPLPDRSLDIVYARQLLHHAGDLKQLVAECARVLKPGGLMLCCREHVVDDDVQLHAYLAAHPIHRLAGGEHAFSLDEYLAAFRAARLNVLMVLGPWDSIINAFPMVGTPDEVRDYPRQVLVRRLGAVGKLLGRMPWITDLVRARLNRSQPGGLHSFLAERPAQA